MYPYLQTHGENFIRIEVYEVDTLKYLDLLEEYTSPPTEYDRRLVTTESGLNVHIYHADHLDLSHLEIITSGDWTKKG